MTELVRRSDEEILERYKAVQGQFLNFQGGDLLVRMKYETAKPYLKEGVTEADFAAAQTHPDPLDEARDYLPFAWDKANNCRGISANRSVDHFRAWLWLAGYDIDDDFDRRYEFYGKPVLVTVSDMLGFAWREHDDGKWRNGEDEQPISKQVVEAHVEEAKRAAKRIVEARDAVKAEA
jgi:hypothetical protein